MPQRLTADGLRKVSAYMRWEMGGDHYALLGTEPGRIRPETREELAAALNAAIAASGGITSHVVGKNADGPLVVDDGNAERDEFQHELKKSLQYNMAIQHLQEDLPLMEGAAQLNQVHLRIIWTPRANRMERGYWVLGVPEALEEGRVSVDHLQDVARAMNQAIRDAQGLHPHESFVEVRPLPGGESYFGVDGAVHDTHTDRYYTLGIRQSAVERHPEIAQALRDSVKVQKVLGELADKLNTPTVNTRQISRITARGVPAAAQGGRDTGFI